MAHQAIKKKPNKSRFDSASKDLIILIIVFVFILVLSYFFDAFKFLVEFFQKHPSSLVWIDEIITGLVALSIGFAVFSWRRWREAKKEFAEHIRLQEELTKIAETKAEVERIIGKQLRCDIEEYKKIEKEVLAKWSQIKKQSK